MRWLQERPADDELARIRSLLEENGIPLYEAHSPRGANQGIYVCLDEQYDDAVALLRNPSHKVTAPIDVEDFYRKLAEAERKSPFL